MPWAEAGVPSSTAKVLKSFWKVEAAWGEKMLTPKSSSLLTEPSRVASGATTLVVNWAADP